MYNKLKVKGGFIPTKMITKNKLDCAFKEVALMEAQVDTKRFEYENYNKTEEIFRRV